MEILIIGLLLVILMVNTSIGISLLTKEKSKQPMVMDICDHIVNVDEIIGIGPLMIISTTDQVLKAAYGSKKYFFYLHLRNQSFRIESDWFVTKGNQDQVDYWKLKAEGFKADYDFSKSEVERLLKGMCNKLPKYYSQPPVPKMKIFSSPEMSAS